MNPLSFSPDHPNYIPHQEKIVRGISQAFYTPNKRLAKDFEEFESIEPDQLDWIDSISQNENGVLYDIGASTGMFVAYAGLRGLQVVAFEPEAHNFAAMEMNHYLNSPHLKNPIIALMTAVSNQPGLGKIFIRDNVQGTHLKILDRPKKVLEEENFEFKHVQHVLKDGLDNLIERYNLPKPQFLKIDVDGHEVELLEGAKKTLKSNTLKSVFIEIAHPESKGKCVYEQLITCGLNELTRTKVQNYEGLYNFVFSR